MSLQLANYKDLEQIAKIEKDTNEHPWSLNNFKSSLDAGNSSIVLKKENIILGYAFFSIVATDSHLLNISVSRNYQGKGYGRKILEKVIQFHLSKLMMLDYLFRRFAQFFFEIVLNKRLQSPVQTEKQEFLIT